MFTFSNPQIKIAIQADIPSIVALLNSAYRGESSMKGWTTEAHLIGGNVRTRRKRFAAGNGAGRQRNTKVP